jgi:hypothetical protein
MANGYTFGDKLQGIGAVLGGTVPQFQKQMGELSEERQKAMYQDADAALKMATRGDLPGVISLIEDRINMIQRLNGDPTESLQALNFARAAQSGDVVAGDKLMQGLTMSQKRGIDLGFIAPPAAPERVIVKEGEDIYEVGPSGEYRRVLKGLSRPEQPQTDIGKIRRDVEAGVITPEEGADLISAGQEERVQAENTLISEANQIYDIANRLLASDLEPITGAFDQLTPTLSSKSVQKEADAAALENLLTLANLGRMSGVLSESDIRILRDAATGGLNLKAGEVQYKNALRRIVSAIQRSSQEKGFDLQSVRYDRDYYDTIESRADIPYHESGYLMPETQEHYDMLFIGEKYVDPEDQMIHIKQ